MVDATGPTEAYEEPQDFKLDLAQKVWSDASRGIVSTQRAICHQ